MIQLPPQQDNCYVEWKGWDASGFGCFRRADGAYFAAELKASDVRLTADTRILEIGFGNATFAGWIQQISKFYVGTEVNPVLLERAKIIGMEAHAGTTNLAGIASGRQFDLVVAFDVLEHLDLPEIIELLRSIRDCLAENGHFIFRVPSGDSPFSGPLMYGDITHKTKLGSRAITQLASLTGLQVVAARDVRLPILGLDVRSALVNAAVRLVRTLATVIIRTAFNGNKRLVVSNNMICVLKLRKTTD